MRYVILIVEYIGSCIRDEFEGEIAIESLGLSEETLEELIVWQNDYRKIIPLSTKEREKIGSKLKN